VSRAKDSETQLVPPLEWLDSSDASQVALVFLGPAVVFPRAAPFRGQKW